jgi:hypothetical protein
MKRRCASCLSAGLVCLCMLQEAPTPKAVVVGAIVTTTVTVGSVSPTLYFSSVVDLTSGAHRDVMPDRRPLYGEHADRPKAPPGTDPL